MSNANGSATCVKVYTFDREQLHAAGTSPAAYCPDISPDERAYVDGQVIQERVRAYRRDHPRVSVAQAQAAVFQADPALRRRYALAMLRSGETVERLPWTTPAQGGAPSAGLDAAIRRREAGLEVLARARARIARSRSGTLNMEQAIRLELAADPELTKRYLGRG